MAQLELLCPTEDEIADAQEGLGHILELDEIGEIDLPPYLTRLLLQLQEILIATESRPAGRGIAARKVAEALGR